MKCPNPACRAENPDEATFCRACGRKFLLIDRFPEFKFTAISPNTPWPTNSGQKKSLRSLYVLALLAMLAIIGYCVYSYFIYDIYEGIDNYGDIYIEINDVLSWSRSSDDTLEEAISRYHEPFIVYGILASIGALLLLFLIACVNKIKCYTTSSKLSDFADYIQPKSIRKEYNRITNQHVFSIYIKGNRFGILDVSEKKVILPLMYDEVRYLLHGYDSYLKVRVNDYWGIIKMTPPKPEILLSPEYNTIELVDNKMILFQCTINGKVIIIDRYGRVRE